MDRTTDREFKVMNSIRALERVTPRLAEAMDSLRDLYPNQTKVNLISAAIKALIELPEEGRDALVLGK